MDLEAYFSFLKKVLGLIPFNIFDYIALFTFVVYVFEDAVFGIIPASISLASSLSAFFLGLIFYPVVSEVFVENFSLTKGISDALSFLLLTGFSFIIVSFSLSILKRKISVNFPKIIDAIGGGFFGALSFFFIASFAVSLLLSFPVSEVIKDSVRNSLSGRFLFTKTQGIEIRVKKIFGGAIEETINFLTIKQGSTETVKLNFTTSQVRVDQKSEFKMASLINIERKKRGLSEIYVDEKLREAARLHAKDMLERGYFSHYTPEGISPFDRMEAANVAYKFAGENLAFAPDIQIAMNGLMKSQGHRDNILSPNFRKAGIGVLDAGIFGKIFVQEFTD